MAASPFGPDVVEPVDEPHDPRVALVDVVARVVGDQAAQRVADDRRMQAADLDDLAGCLMAVEMKDAVAGRFQTETRARCRQGVGVVHGGDDTQHGSG